MRILNSAACACTRRLRQVSGHPVAVRRVLVGLFVVALSLPGQLLAASYGQYTVKPGDLLYVSVWREPELQRDVLVRPDGGFSMPLVGDMNATNLTVDALRVEIEKRLQRFIPEPAVSVAVKEIRGNAIYVIGKVNRPGQYVMSADTDVMQALSLAGGTATFAKLNSIQILRRDGSKLSSIPFRYGDVEDGDNLKQNILLSPGDVVVIP